MSTRSRKEVPLGSRAPLTHKAVKPHRRPTLGHSINIQHRDSRTLSIKVPAHNRRCTVVCAEQSHPSGPPNDFRQRRNLPLKQPILHPSHHTSKWPNINPHGDSRQQAFAKTRAKRSAQQIFIVIVVLVILVFKVCKSDRLCGLVVRVLGYRSGGPGSIPGTTRKKSNGSGTGSTEPREYNWGATW
jgi:hypothetical protein